jgi:hypothetical protein
MSAGTGVVDEELSFIPINPYPDPARPRWTRPGSRHHRCAITSTIGDLGNQLILASSHHHLHRHPRRRHLTAIAESWISGKASDCPER